jgi:uncharacterized membrane protein YdfJ with MMPL/SSD domain
MALGEDYNILVMSRIREEARQAPLRQAVADAMHHTGTTVTSAGLILAATFGVAGLTGATTQIKELGTAIALGVLLDTFFVRTLLVPAIVVVCGRWNWWPYKLSRATPVTPGPDLDQRFLTSSRRASSPSESSCSLAAASSSASGIPQTAADLGDCLLAACGQFDAQRASSPGERLSGR